MHDFTSCSAVQALKRLEQGNARYLLSPTNPGDTSPELRRETFASGQQPYAIVLTCSDSRVIPEHIFSAGIGELFVIRVAGNVVDSHQLGSIVYAAEHLGTRLVLVLGHTRCGAVQAAISGDAEGTIRCITDEISLAIDRETDDYRACCRNVRWGVKRILENPDIQALEAHGLEVRGAVYRTDSGAVEILPQLEKVFQG